MDKVIQKLQRFTPKPETCFNQWSQAAYSIPQAAQQPGTLALGSGSRLFSTGKTSCSWI